MIVAHAHRWVSLLGHLGARAARLFGAPAATRLCPDQAPNRQL